MHPIGARIVIRGRGTSNKLSDGGDDEDMHVLITADTSEQADKAEKLVNEILHCIVLNSV